MECAFAFTARCTRADNPVVETLNAILLGAIQGLTEFLPVSSSGHLVLASHLMGRQIEDGGTALSVLLHLGSLLAILIVFRKDILALFLPRVAWRRLALLVMVSVPAVIAGAAIKLGLDEMQVNWVEAHVLQSPWVAACGLLFTALILWLAEKPRQPRVTLDARGREFWMAALVGVAQAVAILPGVSRSGATICTALMLCWVRSDAVRLSFLMGVVAIGGAGLVEARNIAHFDAAPALGGFASSLMFSLIGLGAVKLVVAKQKLRWFSVYCALAGVAALVWLLFR